jgi:hypothetical protein
MQSISFYTRQYPNNKDDYGFLSGKYFGVCAINGVPKYSSPVSFDNCILAMNDILSQWESIKGHEAIQEIMK